MMARHLPILLVAFPLIMSFLTFMVGIFYRRVSYYFAFITMAFCTFAALTITFNISATHKSLRYHIGGWPPPWGIEYAIDELNSFLLPALALIGLLVLLHCRQSVKREIPEDKVHVFYALILLQMTGLFGMTVTSDIFNLYVLLEIASFSAYGLIAAGKRGAEFAAFRYMIFGTIGACAYLLGVGYLYILTGSLNMTDLSQILPRIYGSTTLLAGFTFLVLGLGIKMAFFPLHIWLPDAYSTAPSQVSTLLAPLFTKVSAYVLFRLVLNVFHPFYSLSLYPIFSLLGWIAAGGILYAGVMAIAQSDVRRMLCYILVVEIGYIVFGLSAGNRLGLMGAILHILNDMFMMALLFAAWNSINLLIKSSKIADWHGINKRYPLPIFTFILGGLAVIGIPPFCGFFSKWYLLLGLIKANNFIFAAILLVSSLFTAICFFRIIEAVYLTPGNNHSLLPPSPRTPGYLKEGIVLGLLTFTLIILGLASGYLMEFIEKFSALGTL